MRAVAVLAVIAYHYNLGPFKGGFLGVDIFFVISGYVITRRLNGYQSTFIPTLKDFYLKRAKRLLPASLSVILLTALFSRLLLPAISLHQIARESLAATFFLPNLYFAHEQNNYLNQGFDPSPYLHFWSLGVEEQFYLLWPLLLLVILRKKLMGIVLTLIVATCFALLLSRHNPVAAFYQPWMRAWEFLAGAVLVFLTSIKGKALQWAALLLGWGGILLSALFISTSHPTPGLTTMIPVFSTVLVIAAASKFSFHHWLVHIGDISYSLYLVHWPLFIILTSRYQGLNVFERILMGFGALLISSLMYKYIETPLRSAKRIARLQLFAIPIALVALLSVGVLESGASAHTGNIRISREVPILYSDGCHLSFGNATPKAGCLFGDTSSSVNVLLVGDSHAAMHFPGINLLAQKNHWRLITFTKSSCPAAQLSIIRASQLDSACIAWEKNLAKEFLRFRAKYIFLAGATEQNYLLSKDSLSSAAGFQVVLSEALASGAKPVLLSETPYPGVDSPSCILRNLKNPAACDLAPPHSTTTRDWMAVALAKGAIVFDPTSYLCKANRCPAVFNNANVYRDASHITIATSLRMEPFIARQLAQSAP